MSPSVPRQINICVGRERLPPFWGGEVGWMLGFWGEKQPK